MLDLEGRGMVYLDDYQRLVMTMNDERNFARAFECYICHRPFNKDKVRDQEHLPGDYRGAAQERCNLMLRKRSMVPVFFHNFRGYDSHLIVWGLRSIPSARHKPHRSRNGEEPDAGLGRAPGVQGQPAIPCQLAPDPGLQSGQICEGHLQAPWGFLPGQCGSTPTLRHAARQGRLPLLAPRCMRQDQ